MNCRCTSDTRHDCAGGGITPQGSACRCLCHAAPVIARATRNLRASVAEVTGAAPADVDIVFTAERNGHRVHVSLAGGDVRVSAWRPAPEDAAQLVVSALTASLPLGATTPAATEVSS